MAYNNGLVLVADVGPDAHLADGSPGILWPERDANRKRRADYGIDILRQEALSRNPIFPASVFQPRSSFSKKLTLLARRL